MLDPVTISTGVAALLKASYSIVFELKAFKDRAAGVQDKLDGLLQDVEALNLVLSSMRETFETIAVGSDTGHISDHWQNISRALENGNETLSQLRSCLEDINRSNKILDGPRKQLRLDFATDKLDFFRQHIQSYRDALQLSLQTVILWTQLSQKQSTDLLLPSVSSLHQEVRRVASVLNQRIEALHSVIADQAPKENTMCQRDSQWHDESQMVAMCILRDCIRSAATIVSTASTRISSDAGADASVRAGDSDIGDLFPRRSNVMLQRFVESRLTQDYGRGSSPPELRSLASVAPFECALVDYPDSDDDLEVDIATGLLLKAKKILSIGMKIPTDRSRAERYLINCLHRLSHASFSGQRDKFKENWRSEIEALELLISIHCENSQWSDARSMLVKKMAVKERFCSKDDSTLVVDVLLLARLLLESRDYVEAHLHARRALKAYRKISDVRGSAESIQLLVNICQSDNKEDEAEAYEALLAKLDPGQSMLMEVGVSGRSKQERNVTHEIVSGGTRDEGHDASGPEDLSNTTDLIPTPQTPVRFSGRQQRSLSSIISNAKVAADSSTKKANISRNRKPKLIPRGANEREPILELPPFQEENEEDNEHHQQKPKLIPRGANEREPTIELPPFPEDQIQQPKLAPHGGNERELIVERPPDLDEEKNMMWDRARLWPKRKKPTKTAKLRPAIPITIETILEDDTEKQGLKSQLERTPDDLRKSRSKSIDILVAQSPVTKAAASKPKLTHKTQSSISIRKARSSSILTLGGPAPSVPTKIVSKPSLSRFEIAARSTVYDDQVLRRNRAWLLALMSFTESDAIPLPASESTSDLLTGIPLDSYCPQRDQSCDASIASSEALPLALRMTHPAFRPEGAAETWI